MKEVHIKENSWIARIAAARLKADMVAIVIGNRIHLYHTSREDFLKDKKWVAHELKHVEQYRQYGFMGFIARYLFESARNGYYNNRFEAEARESENDESLINRYRII